MTHQEREAMVKCAFDKFILPVLRAKGKDYSGMGDTNANFKRTARRVGLQSVDQYVVWQVFFDKHLDAIQTWLRDKQVKSEPVHMRIVDAINYLLILWTMAIDDGFSPHPESADEQL